MSQNKSLFLELWYFLRKRKAWWLFPIILMLIVVGFLIIFVQESAVSPFIYTIL